MNTSYVSLNSLVQNLYEPIRTRRVDATMITRLRRIRTRAVITIHLFFFGACLYSNNLATRTIAVTDSNIVGPKSITRLRATEVAWLSNIINSSFSSCLV